jgi:ABC-2 type transport system permease protein
MRNVLRLFSQAALARAYPRAAWMFRNRTWLFQETLLPILSVSAFAFSYQAMLGPDQSGKFVGMVILGGAMTTFWMNVLWAMGAHLYWERDSGNLGLYVMSPAPMMSILAGMALGGMTTTTVRAAAIIAAGLLFFDVPLQPTSWWLLVAIFLLTMAALYGLGMMFASLFLLWGREAWHTVNLLQEPVYLLTGMNFPLKLVFPMAVAGVALLIPLAAGMDAMRQVLNFVPPGQGVLSVGAEIALLAVLAVVFLGSAKVCLDYLERKSREDGKLTVRWE